MKLKYPAISDALPLAERRFSILVPFALGMAINIISIAIGNPYLVSLIGLVAACIATIAWRNMPIFWIVLASIVAANPVNTNATISLNLLFATMFFMLNMHYLNKLPVLLLLINIFALLSALLSAFNWSAGFSPGSLFTQGAAVANYLLGPFFFIPLIFSRLKERIEPELLLKILIFALIVPTLVLLSLARGFGQPVSDYNPTLFDYMVNVSIFQLGNVEFTLTRTQVGIVLASLISASVAVVIRNVGLWLRLIAAGCVAVSIFLLLITGSVGSSIAAVCGIVSIFFVGKRYFSIKSYVIVALASASLFIGGWFLLPEGVQKYAGSRYEERFYGSGLDVSDRISRWQSSVQYLIDNPIGVGWSLYIEPIDAYPHNDYLSYAIAFGVISGLLYLFVSVWMLFSLSTFKSHITQPAQSAVVLAGVGVATVLVVNSFSDHLIANRWYFNVVWSIIWFAYFSSTASATQNSSQQFSRR